MKQVDLLFVCPETRKRVAIELCVTTHDTEIEQAQRDLAEGADAVIILCPNRDALARLEKTFTRSLGSKIDRRITLALPCHLVEAPSLRHVYECSSLVYNSKWHVSGRVRRKGGAAH